MSNFLENIFSLGWIKSYKKDYLQKDITAGLSVAAIALPVGIAYSSIAGLPPETGLYSCIFPMIAYALFGSSRQLIVGPDAATCILVASSLATLSATGSAEYQTLSAMLAIITGILCVFSGLFKLGFLADFLSRPVLSGYLNGLALSIILGQLGKLFGYSIISSGFLRTLFDFITKLGNTNFTALIIGVSVFIFLRFSKKYFKMFPAPLFAVIIGIMLVMILDLGKTGIAVVGKIPKGFPMPGIPGVSIDNVEALFGDAAAIVMISFCSAMLTSKSFALKNNYSINPNKDFIALGMASFFSGLFKGFVVSGADSRTAVNDTAGGKTQLVSIIASFTIFIVVLFFTSYLEFLPVSVLSAIIISASIGLIDLNYLKKLFNVSKQEFWLAIITFASVLSVGVIKAVLISVTLSMIWLLKRAIKPKITILGKIEGIESFQDKEDYEEAVTYPGMLVLRFEASMLFFNADYFKTAIYQRIDEQKEKVRFVILDASPVIVMDVTAADVVVSLQTELEKKGCELMIARARPNVRTLLQNTGFKTNELKDNFFITVNQCVNALNDENINKN